MAGASRRFRTMAVAGQFRCVRTAEGRAVYLEQRREMMPLSVAEKRARFSELHKGPGCFVIPNPWDVGSTKYLASLGFKALATTSAGAVFAAACPDGGRTRAAVLHHIGELVAAADLPFNADYEAGYASTLEDLHE